MSAEVRNLEPKAMWNHFADLNEVPRPSKKEEKVIAFMKNFGESLGLNTQVDEVGNVIIKKSATAGMESRKTVVLQSHIDMVHQKNADTQFDFDTQGIEMYVEGDWVRARGTTLGSDNGIGVASIMAVLGSSDIAHPKLEALFTIDEETGMTGALGLKGGVLEADIMLNLDTEEDDELTIGCAGGVDVTGSGTYEQHDGPSNFVGYKIKVKGLTGGHSGGDIQRGRGNANKLMNRLLFNASGKFDLKVVSIDGGSLRNAIPRESFAEVVVPNNDEADFVQFLKEQEGIYQQEYATTDPELSVVFEKSTTSAKVLSADFQEKLFKVIYACPYGVYRMSADMEDLVQTSNNLARVLVKDGNYSLQCLTRSAIESEKWDFSQAIQSSFELLGAKVEKTGSYPGWTPKLGASILKVMRSLYKEMFGQDAKVSATHGGLECGILGSNYPDMELISFGPNIRGAHSPDERAQISSIQKYWSFFLEILKRIPEKE